FTLVKSKCLLVQIPEQMKRFDAHISPFDAALEQAPEVLQPVRVDVPFGVALGVIDHLVDIFISQSLVGFECVCVNGRALLDILANFAPQRMSSDSVDDFTTHARNSV